MLKRVVKVINYSLKSLLGAYLHKAILNCTNINPNSHLLMKIVDYPPVLSINLTVVS